MTDRDPNRSAQDRPRGDGLIVPEDLCATDELLHERRPLPSPNFRGALRRSLMKPGRSSRKLPSLALIQTYACVGTVLLAVVGLGAAGVGPLAP